MPAEGVSTEERLSEVDLAEYNGERVGKVKARLSRKQKRKDWLRDLTEVGRVQ